MNILLKILVFVVKKITLLVAIGFFLLLVTVTAYDCANVYMVLNEGLNERAMVVFENEDPLLLSKFFTQRFLTNDRVLETRPYELYSIQDYDYRASVKWLWVWPWNTSTRVTVAESAENILGKRIQTSDSTDKSGTQEQSPPPWENGIKHVIMKKVSGRWLIDDIIFKEPLNSNSDTTDEETQNPDNTDNTDNTENDTGSAQNFTDDTE